MKRILFAPVGLFSFAALFTQSAFANTTAWMNDTYKGCAVYSDPADPTTSLVVQQLSVVSTSQCRAPLVYDAASHTLLSTSYALVDGRYQHLIPAILNLADQQPVPGVVYTTYSANLVATSLVTRMHNVDQTNANDANPAYDFQKNAMIQMRFDDSHVAAIVQQGFLNQHEVTNTDGALDNSGRATVEDALIKVQLEPTYTWGPTNPVNNVRPKYSFLTFPSDGDANHVDNLVPQYGNVIAVLNESVKNRATFTASDSLDAYQQTSAVHNYTFGYKSVTPVAKDQTVDGGAGYWETQIWGTLSVQDVSYFLVSCPGETPLQPTTIGILQQTGRPIYNCIVAADNSHFDKGALISSGN